jgi:hypothetical protein
MGGSSAIRQSKTILARSVKRIGQRSGLIKLGAVMFSAIFLFVGRTIAKSVWAEIHTAYASDIPPDRLSAILR